ncbi:MAG: hypothetical protein V8S58_09405 [Lachnospiraceae bacterium]
MNISQITGVYFSPTGSTKRVTEWITERIADNREAEWLDLTDAVSSRPDYTFTEHELAVVGVPVYGGRVPETARERLQKLHGKRTPAVLIVTYGNRAYEDALLELSDILKEQGFIPAAAAAVVTEHNIAHVYGAGRPDEKDKKEMTAFAEAVREKLKSTAGSYKAFGAFYPGQPSVPPIWHIAIKNQCLFSLRGLWNLHPQVSGPGYFPYGCEGDR